MLFRASFPVDLHPGYGWSNGETIIFTSHWQRILREANQKAAQACLALATREAAHALVVVTRVARGVLQGFRSLGTGHRGSIHHLASGLPVYKCRLRR